MVEILSNSKTRFITPILQIMALVLVLLYLSTGAVLLSGGGGTVGLSLALSVLIGLGQAALCLFAAGAVRSRQNAGFVLAIALALLQLPSLMFPMSLAIFWCLLPDELTQGLVAQVRVSLKPTNKNTS
jgi:hypothetical protein